MANHHPSSATLPAAIECTQEVRIEKIEDRLDRHDERFSAGDAKFVGIDVKLDMVINVLKWVGGTIGTGIILMGLSAFFYVVHLMAKQP
jgi:hypothetical protein